MKSEYHIILNGSIRVECCDKRKKAFEQEGYDVTVMTSAENIKQFSRHCRIKPCLREYKR